MQLCFPISDESSNVTSQFSTVKSDSRIKVVVLLKHQNANLLNVAAKLFQQLCHVSNRSCNLAVHGAETRLNQPTDTQCFAGNRSIGRFRSFRVDRQSIDAIGSLDDGKRRSNIAHAAG